MGLLEALEGYAGNPLLQYTREPGGWGGMNPPQAAFHRSQARLRFCLWANSLGKTYGGAAETWWHLLDRHPFREVPDITGEYWLLADDLQQGWKSVCKNLRLLEPPGVVDSSCTYDELRGYVWRGKKTLRLANGRMLVGKGGSQTAKAMEGDRIDGLWVDEPPKRQHWNGCVSRVNRTFGPIWVTMTAVAVTQSEGIEWLKHKVYGDPEEGKPAEGGSFPDDDDGWDFIQKGLNESNAPHLSANERRALITGCDPWEVPQRVHALWGGIAPGRRLNAFSPAHVIDDADLPEEVDQIRLSFDYGEGVGKMVGYLQLKAASRWYIAREIMPRYPDSHPEAGQLIPAPTPAQLARETDLALKSLGLTHHHIAADYGRAFGDINSAGLLGGGAKYSAMLEHAFRKLYGLSSPPFQIETPYKGRGSVGAGEAAMNLAFREGRYFVVRPCRRFIDAAKRYTGIERDLKDPIDGARYGVADDLLSFDGGASPTVRFR